jgi:hypothetical protein
VFSIRPISTASSDRKIFSPADLIIIGLVLVILMGISLPLFHSAPKSASERPTTAPIVSAASASVKAAAVPKSEAVR